MMSYNKSITVLFLLVFCFSYVSSKNKIQCSDYKKHPNWSVLQEASSSCGLTGGSVAQRIMGGKTAELAEFPWMALLTYSTCSATCGGSLITSRHVVTAAHCCDLSWSKKGCTVIGVRLGEYDLETKVDCYKGVCAPEALQVPVEKVTVHEGYDLNTNTLNHDVCLLTLEKNVEPSVFVNPICVADRCTWKEPNFRWDTLKIAGWGSLLDHPRRRSLTLQTLDMMATPHSICAYLWQAQGHSVSEDFQLCAGMEIGQDKCKGDSGGPLMHQARDRMVLVGVTSFGQNCSHEDKFLRPGVYTRISHYIPWILDNL